MSIPSKRFQCGACGNILEIPQGEPKPPNCPRCGAPGTMIHRLDKGPPGGGRGRGGGPPWQRSQP
ncbi:MAG: hypothetical protein QXK52_07320 [Candidatus Bathyarchaeia archaeon]